VTDQPNPAVVAEPEEPQERTYRVTGHAQETLGHQHGETFTALLPADQEAALIAGGAISRVDDSDSSSDGATGDGDANDESHGDSETNAETPDQPADQSRNRRRQPVAPDAPTTKE
jgi:hypothetical protein